VSDDTRCGWCHQETDGDRTAEFDNGTVLVVCSAEHERELRDTHALLVTRVPLFFAGLFGGGAITVAGAVWPQFTLLLPAGLIVFGLAIAFAPMVTPQTIEVFGFRRGLALGRGIGLAGILCGVVWAIALLT